MGSSNFSTSHWNTDSYPSLSLALHVGYSRFPPLYLCLSLSLSLFLSFLLHATLLPPHEFTSISILIPSSVTLLRWHSFVVKATYNRFLGNFFFGTTRPLFFRDTRIGSRKMQKPSSFPLCYFRDHIAQCW